MASPGAAVGRDRPGRTLFEPGPVLHDDAAALDRDRRGQRGVLRAAHAQSGA